MDKVTEIFKDIPKEDLIKSRQHYMDQNVKLSNELYSIKQPIKDRINRWEKYKETFKKEEPTKSNTMLLMNIQEELDFLNSLLGH